MVELDWTIDFEDSIETERVLDSDKTSIITKPTLDRFKVLEKFIDSEKSLNQVAEETEYSYNALHNLDLEENGWITQTSKDGRTQFYTGTDKAEELLETFYTEKRMEGVFKEGTEKYQVVTRLLGTFYENPRSFEALNRIGADNSWSDLVNRLEQKQKEEDVVLHPSKEPITDFSSTTPESTLSDEVESKGPNKRSKEEVERIRNLRNQNSQKRNTGDDGVMVNGGLDYEMVEDLLSVYDLENELNSLNEELNTSLEIQLSSVTSVDEGFYATDVLNGPWHVDFDERKLPNSFDYLLVEKNGKGSRVAGLPSGEVTGYVEERGEDHIVSEL